MTQSELFDRIQEKYPFVFRNNRGCATIGKRFIRFGIPEPRTKESDWDMKGSDFVGIDEKTGKFLCIEAKTVTDRLKDGQIRWHNFILSLGGISEIWIEKKDGTIEVVREKIGEPITQENANLETTKR